MSFFQKTSPRGLSSLFAAALMAGGLALGSASASAQTRLIDIADGQVSNVIISPGHTLTIETDEPFANIVIGNTDVVDVFPLTETSLYLQAKNSGFTNVTLYNDAQKLLEVIDIRIKVDYTELRTAIGRAVPSAQVEVTNVNDRIRLSGTVKDNVDLGRVLEIADQYSTEPVVNALRVAAAQQVQLDVRILEVNRNSGRELGVELTGTKQSSGLQRFSTGANAATSVAPFGNAVGHLLSISGTSVDYVINALEEKGLARRLANPSLVTTSGIEANFVVGGEIPIDKSIIEDGEVATETGYREYGVRLNFLPTVLDNNLISLRISPEVSDVDTSLTVNGQPAFISRKAETTVSLRDGQSFAIAGLLQASNERNVEQVPWLGQVPVLGALFRSTAFQKRETDLVILVTPHLVRPAAPDEPLRSPLDDARSSDDVELFLLGMLEVDRQLLRRFAEGDGVIGPYGHMIDLEFEDGLIEKK
ncbi:type II and III secretion system protein family protein [Actibacterium sp. MT2.3-13A]|uniref:type II and III secretion system protein family protein n=1 Tax=Actibacterium sp. MT2.3-13A TaxID=2828332 RepID=UPI001BAB839C|nr:type II and III secretion system protein family protein [Actibacterium sp. MT2.3-13A]